MQHVTRIPMSSAVASVMSRFPVLVDARASAELAASIATMHGVHHLLVVDEAELVGVVCRCDLENAEPGDAVSSLMCSPATVIGEDDELEQAARVMIECGVGCLPVVGRTKTLAGVVTRRDLRSAGVLPGRRGFDRCVACGTSHRLRPPADPAQAAICFGCFRKSVQVEHAATNL
jgi:acetoin utilization protein AcuB